MLQSRLTGTELVDPPWVSRLTGTELVDPPWVSSRLTGTELVDPPWVSRLTGTEIVGPNPGFYLIELVGCSGRCMSMINFVGSCLNWMQP